MSMATQKKRENIVDQIRSIIPLGFKTKIVRSLVHSKIINRLSISQNGRVSAKGITYDLSNGYEQRAAAIRFGLYERAETFMARKFIDGQLDVIELGASLGIISCILAKQIPERRLISVEAEPRLAERTRRNLELNKLGNATVENLAIDYSGQEEVIFSSDDSLGGQIAKSNGTRVKATTLKALVEKWQIDQFDLVIDIEGAELDIFENDAAILRQGCRRLLIEMDGGELLGKKIEMDAEFKLIEAVGFKCIYRHANCATFERHIV